MIHIDSQRYPGGPGGDRVIEQPVLRHTDIPIIVYLPLKKYKPRNEGCPILRLLLLRGSLEIRSDLLGGRHVKPFDRDAFRKGKRIQSPYRQFGDVINAANTGGQHSARTTYAADRPLHVRQILPAVASHIIDASQIRRGIIRPQRRSGQNLVRRINTGQRDTNSFVYQARGDFGSGARHRDLDHNAGVNGRQRERGIDLLRLCRSPGLQLDFMNAMSKCLPDQYFQSCQPAWNPPVSG
jgi:hypothetical protein